jgi:hypothetical protein
MTNVTCPTYVDEGEETGLLSLTWITPTDSELSTMDAKRKRKVRHPVYFHGLRDNVLCLWPLALISRWSETVGSIRGLGINGICQGHNGASLPLSR